MTYGAFNPAPPGVKSPLEAGCGKPGSPKKMPPMKPVKKPVKKGK